MKETTKQSKAIMFANSNNRQFQRGLDPEKARATRRDAQLSLRKKTREAHLQKKKRMLSNRAPAHLSSSNSTIMGHQEKVPSIADIPKLIAKVMNADNLDIQLQGVSGLRQMLSVQRDPPTLRIVRSGAVPKIINFMYSNSKKDKETIHDRDVRKKIQFEAAWTITNICAGATQCTVAMVKLGAIKAFVDLLRNAEDEEMAEMAIWGLANILGEGRKVKDQILSSGVIQDFVQIIQKSEQANVSVLRNAVFALTNFCRCSRFELKQINTIIPAITNLLKDMKDDELVSDALWCLVHITNQNEQIINYLAKSGAITIAMKYLHQETAKYEVALQQTSSQQTIINSNKKSNLPRNVTKEAALKMNERVYRPCLRMLANMVSGEDYLTQRVLDAGFLDVIYPFMTHFCATFRKEMMWCLSNILAGSHQQIEAVLSRPKIFETLIQCAKTDVYSVQMEACYGICNVLVDSISAQKKKLVEHGAIEALVGFLKNKHLNEKAMSIILEGLEAFLSIYGERNNERQFNPYADRVEQCGGLDVLEDLIADENLSEGIYNMLANILQKYWICDENVEGVIDENSNNANVLQQVLQATVDTNTNQFKFGCGSSMQPASSKPFQQSNVSISSGVSTGNERFAF